MRLPADRSDELQAAGVGGLDVDLRSRRGVAPHNNAAKRALRHGVFWRKTSYETFASGTANS